ncbi:MAG: ribosomal protein S18-alanine N-acetyltransferase [Acidimicrobiales bacterium]
MGFHFTALRKKGAPGSLQSGLEIVPMKRRHLKAVVAIEQQVFPSPWSLSLYLSELALPSTRSYHVATVGGEVVAYAGLMVAAGEGHVTTIGVDPSWQHKGIGRRLLLTLARAALERGADGMTLEVRMTNRTAQELYHEFGFVPAGIRKNYYSEVNEDAIVMWAHGLQSEAMRARLDAIARRVVSEDEAEGGQ